MVALLEGVMDRKQCVISLFIIAQVSFPSAQLQLCVPFRILLRNFVTFWGVYIPLITMPAMRQSSSQL